MAKDERRCPQCGQEPDARDYCQKCGAILWYWVVAALMGGSACVVLGWQTAYRAYYWFEPLFGAVVSLLGLSELTWTGWQLIQAYRLRKKLRASGSAKNI